MAEPFSIATGALQVADAGIKLAKTLYEYLDAVRNANKHLKAIALEVRVTSSTLESLGTLLKDHDAEKLCSKNVVYDAEAAFDGCKEAFTEVDDTFRAVVKFGADGKASVSASGRWAWPFKKGKVEMLQANLERLKTTLLLMLSVLSFAREQAKSSAESEMRLTVERLQIQNLIKANDDATERYDQLVIAFSRLGTGTPARSATSTSDTTLVPEDTRMYNFAMLQPKDTASSNSATSTREIDDDPDDPLLQHLSTCAFALSHLSQKLESVTARWRADQHLERMSLMQSYDTVERAFRRFDLRYMNAAFGEPPKSALIGRHDSSHSAQYGRAEFDANALATSVATAMAIVERDGQPQAEIPEVTKVVYPQQQSPLQRPPPQRSPPQQPPPQQTALRQVLLAQQQSGTARQKSQVALCGAPHYPAGSPALLPRSERSRYEALQRPPRFEPSQSEMHSPASPSPPVADTTPATSQVFATAAGGVEGNIDLAFAPPESSGVLDTFDFDSFLNGHESVDFKIKEDTERRSRTPSSLNASSGYGDTGLEASESPFYGPECEETVEGCEEEADQGNAFALLEGRVINDAGYVTDDEGIPVARIAEGKVRDSAGRRVGADGEVRDSQGRPIARIELIPEDTRLKRVGPFAGFEGLRAVGEGKVVDDEGSVAGELVNGDSRDLAGMSVDEDGDVIDKNGNVKGHAEPLEQTAARSPGLQSASGAGERKDEEIGQSGSKVGKRSPSLVEEDDLEFPMVPASGAAKREGSPSRKRRFEDNNEKEQQQPVVKKRETRADPESHDNKPADPLDAVDELLMRWTTVGLR